MVIIIVDIALHRALQSKKKKIFTFTDHLLLIIALSEHEGLLLTFSIRRTRPRVVNMTCKC